jgi:hypothetical protein
MRTKGIISINDSMRWIAHIIEQYGVTKIPVFGYNVRILQYYADLPIVSIEGAQFSDNCPVCKKATEVGYLRTDKENFDKDYDIVIVNCLDCGCLFATKGDNHRKFQVDIK